MNMSIKKLLITTLFLLISSFHFLYGQGWEKSYGREKSDLFASTAQTEDDGYLALGHSLNPNTDIYELFLQKTDVDGNEQWSKYYGVSGVDIYGRELLLTDDGGILIVGLISSSDEVYLLKTDINGVEEWSNQFNYGGDAWYPSAILQAEDGGYFLSVNQNNDDVWYGKISPLGIEEWSYTILLNGPGSIQYPSDVEILPDGYLLSGINKLVKLNLSGEEVWVQTMEGSDKITNMIPVSDGNFMLVNATAGFGHRLSKRNPSGDEIWNSIVPIGGDTRAVQIVETDDGGFILVNVRGINISPPSGFTYITEILKTNSFGEEEWKKDVGPIGFYTNFLTKDSSGHLIFAGRNVYYDPSEQPIDAFLMKTNQQGNFYSNYITGNVFNDNNQNCAFEEGVEDGSPNKLVKIAGDKTFYGTTDEMGNYNIAVDTGNYEVSVILNNPYWATCSPQPISILELNTDTVIDLATQVMTPCPWLTVDVSTPFLRRCFENNYTIHYCNDGTITAEDAYIEVSFDPFLEVISSDLMWSNELDNTYTFNVGAVAPNECGSFKVNTFLNCDDTVLGQTHCTEAHIFPDSICLPNTANWDGSSIVVEAECDVDSVRFLIRNVGDGNMLEALNYIIIEDEIMVHQDNFQLNAGQSEIVSNGFSNGGSTYRIIAEQAIGHPGNSMPTAAIEGCGTTIFPVGFFNMFSQDDGDFFLSTDCQENIGSYDPNDKQAFPKGYDDEHYIWQNIDLEYFIRFQNTGTDTAFTVVIEDMISEHLDITTLQMGASSHAYTYSIDGKGVLKVRFDNILLPDSMTNQLGSNGFFKYKIKQQPDNPIGTMIYNEAAIYFDFNAPIITNETFHEVGEPFFGATIFTNDSTTTTTASTADIKLHVFPNPFGEFTTFKIENLPAEKTDFLLYDNLGRLVRKEVVLDGAEFQFYRKELAAGLYFYDFRQAGVSIANGRMVAE